VAYLLVRGPGQISGYQTVRWVGAMVRTVRAPIWSPAVAAAAAARVCLPSEDTSHSDKEIDEKSRTTFFDPPPKKLNMRCGYIHVFLEI
jgi:hypothetical protein